MSVKDGLPATDFNRMNREYVKNLAQGETVPDGLPATDFSRMNREYIKAVVEEAGGGGGGADIEVEAVTFTENGTFTAPEGKAYSPVTVNVPTGGDWTITEVTLMADTANRNELCDAIMPNLPQYQLAVFWLKSLIETGVQGHIMGGYVQKKGSANYGGVSMRYNAGYSSGDGVAKTGDQFCWIGELPGWR